MENLKVSQINIYPVKSCAGLAFQSAHVVDTGFEYDRQWMVVDGEGKFITQRQYAKMSLVKTSLIDNGVRLEAPDTNPIDAPIVFDGKKFETEVWGNACVGVDQGEAISKWLSEYIGKECHLIIMSPDFKRGVDEKYKTKGDEIVGKNTCPV